MAIAVSAEANAPFASGLHPRNITLCPSADKNSGNFSEAPEFRISRVRTVQGLLFPPSDVEVGKKAVLGVFGKVRPEHVCRSAKAVCRLL